MFLKNKQGHNNSAHYDNVECFRFPLARSMQRKIIYHAGPTNSGKTYQALSAFLAAESGVYCGPLRLLAMEVYDKATQKVRFYLPKRGI